LSARTYDGIGFSTPSLCKANEWVGVLFLKGREKKGASGIRGSARSHGAARERNKG